jgi:hypothetical protein
MRALKTTGINWLSSRKAGSSDPVVANALEHLETIAVIEGRERIEN